MRLSDWTRCVVAGWACLFCGATLAGDGLGISVQGSGESRVKPDRVEIVVRASGTGELTSDARVKYQDSLRRMTDAFESLEIENLKIEQQALTIGRSGGAELSQAALLLGQGGDSPAGNPEVEISRALRIVLTGIDRLPEEQLTETVGRLIDTAHDSGAKVGGGSEATGVLQRMMGVAAQSAVVTFVVSDSAAAREEAFAQAFAEAEASAKRLAALAKVRLGEVLSIEEAAAASNDEADTQQQLISAVYGIALADNDRLTSNEWGEIPVRAALRVRFALIGDGDSPASGKAAKKN